MVTVTALLLSARALNSDPGIAQRRLKCGYILPAWFIQLLYKKVMFHTCKNESNAQICASALHERENMHMQEHTHTFPDYAL